MKPKPEPLDLFKVALFLDLDGTIAPIMPRPDDVEPEAARNGLLKALNDKLEGRLAVVSGRSVSAVDRITEGTVASVAGAHGLERRTASGQREDTEAHAALDSVVSEFRALNRVLEGLIVEDKGVSVAVHYRHEPDHKANIIALATRMAETHGLRLQPGHEVIELRTPGPNKGDAIRAFMCEAPFIGHMPVFVGDDLTDEVGFEAVNSLGGFGVRVGAGSSVARYGLKDVAAVTTWLEESLLCLT
jgi:trehalose 6-phosphate phosphatase